MKKLTHEQFLLKFNEIFQNNIYSLPEDYKYNSLKDKLTMSCNICDNIWETTVLRLIHRKNGCPSCYKNLRHKTHEQFVKDFKTKFPNKNYVFLNEYTSVDKHIEIKCLDCNYIWKNTPDRLLHQGNGCPSCSGNIKRSHQNFIENFKSRFPNKNVEFLSEYQNAHKTIQWKCLDCGAIHTTLVKALYRGRSCVNCSNIKRTKTHEQFLEEFKSKFPNKNYVFLNEYKNSFSKMKIRCDKNPEHIWEATPTSLFGMKSGCPYCANNIKYTHEQFLIRYKEKFPNRNLKFFNEYSGNKTKIKIQCDKDSSHIWKTTSQNLYHKGSSCPYCSVQHSKAEQEISDIFKDVFIKRDKFLETEIDLINHEHKFGIEYNGIIFHSFGITFPNNIDKLNKKKHLEKTNLLESNLYQLFHIQENDWLKSSKKDIWISMISNKLGKINNKIYARKLKIIDLTLFKDFVNNFLEDNHLQGKCNYKYAYGLQNQTTGEVYSIMTFGLSRFDKNIEYELIRFCNVRNHSIPGGASKILKHFERVHQPKSLISYANRDWSKGDLYYKLGFEFIGNTSPNYCYYDNNNKKHSRQSCQKHKLEKKLGKNNFDENLTELENMINNNFRVYYDTGNMKFVKKYEHNSKK